MESTLFFSLPCWIVAAEGLPATYPFQFVFVLLDVATIATVLFHLAPAFFSRKFGPLKNRFFLVLTLCLTTGYIYYPVQLIQFIGTRVRQGGEPILSIILLLLLTIAAFKRNWWKSLVALGLLIGLAILAATLLTPLRGSLQQTHKAWYWEARHVNRVLGEGLLLIAAPALSIGYRVGLMNISARRILWSGVAGMFLPLCLSVSIASLTTQSGDNLYWRPSLDLGFDWALVAARRLAGNGPNTFAATHWALFLTVLFPALQSIISVRIFTTEWSPKERTVLITSVGFGAWLAVSQPFEGLREPPSWGFLLWIIALAATGAVMGLLRLVRRKDNKPADQEAL